MDKLTAKFVQDIMLDCTVTDEEKIQKFSSLDPNISDYVIDDVHFIRGVNHDKYYLDISKLEEYKDEIMEALIMLPKQFLQSSGDGGWSFLNSCVDCQQRQWGEHLHADMLIALGRAIGKVTWLLPEYAWSNLPGGMPYLMVLDGPAPKKSEPKEVNPILRSIMDFFSSVFLLLFCTVVGLFRLILSPVILLSIPIKSIARAAKRDEDGAIIGDSIGDLRKDRESVYVDIIQATFGWKVDYFTRATFTSRGDSYFIRRGLFYYYLARYTAFMLGLY